MTILNTWLSSPFYFLILNYLRFFSRRETSVSNKFKRKLKFVIFIFTYRHRDTD